MNIRAAFAATLAAALLPVGALAAPAYAEDPQPGPTCEETVQEYRDAAAVLSYSLQAVTAEVGRLRADDERLRSDLAAQREQARTAWAATLRAESRAERLALRVSRMDAKLYRLRSIIRGLRQAR